MYNHYLSQMPKLEKEARCLLHELLSYPDVETKERRAVEVNRTRPELLREIDDILKFYMEVLKRKEVLFLEAAFLANGPKLYTLEPSTCEALENVEMTFDSDYYRQPFPIIGLDYTKEHIENRFIKNKIFLTVTEPEVGMVQMVPDYALLHHKEDTFRLSMGIAMKPLNVKAKYVVSCLHAIIILLPGKTLEESYAEFEKSESCRFTDPEKVFVKTILRTMCNMSMLILEHGQRELPDARREKLVAKVSRGGRNENEAFELRTRPQNFAMKQNIELFQKRDVYVGSGNKTGRTVKPHWRNGHWRCQRHGVKLQMVKRVFIKPVYVNVLNLDGSLADTMVTYREKT